MADTPQDNAPNTSELNLNELDPDNPAPQPSAEANSRYNEEIPE